jgi:hypothetical protein
MFRAFDQSMYQRIHIVRRLRARTMRLPREQPSEFLLIHASKICTPDPINHPGITSRKTSNPLIKWGLSAWIIFR